MQRDGNVPVPPGVTCQWDKDNVLPPTDLLMAWNFITSNGVALCCPRVTLGELVAGLMAVNQVVYVAVALRFEYKRVDHGALERAISHVSEETPLLHGGEPSGQSAPIVMGGRRTFVEQARSLAQQYLSPTLPPPFK